MKITDKELDQSLVKKIERLDKVTETFSEDDKSGFLAYDGDNFYIKRANELLLKKVFSASDLDNYHTHLYKESNYIKNSFNTNMNHKNIASKNIGGQGVYLDGFSLYKVANPIKKVKKYGESLLMLDNKGVFYKFSLKDRKEEFAFDFLRKARTDFAIETINPFDILDFEVYGEGFLISTTINGVFYADLKANTIELKFLEDDVKSIKDILNGNVLLTSESGEINVYNFKTGMRVETYNTLKKSNQSQRAVESNGDYVFLLGKSLTSEENSENLLHVWRKDQAGISYDNIDKAVYPGYDSRKHHVMFLSVDGDTAYLSGLKDGKHLFVWKYNTKDLGSEFQEVVFTGIDIDKLNFVKVEGGFITFANNNQIITLDQSGKVVKNFYLKGLKSNDVRNVIFRDSQKDMVIVNGNEVLLYRFPEHRFEKEVIFRIYEGTEACNNIDIYISTNPIKEKISFLDGTTGAEIHPYYAINGEFGYAFKLLGVPSKSINMRVLPDESTNLKGVVVNADRVYLK
jgi:hypothetical protein